MLVLKSDSIAFMANTAAMSCGLIMKKTKNEINAESDDGSEGTTKRKPVECRLQ